MFAIMPEHLKAAHVELYGVPGSEGPKKTYEPLEGISANVASTLLRLLKAQTFTRGPWVRNRLHSQLKENDARGRLEATARGEKQ